MIVFGAWPFPWKSASSPTAVIVQSRSLRGSSRSSGSRDASRVHCGDRIGANTLRVSMKPGLHLHVVHVNNISDQVALHKMMAKSGGPLIYHGQDAEMVLGGRRIFAAHYLHYGRGMACTGIMTWFAAVKAMSPWKKDTKLAMPVVYYSQLMVTCGGSLKKAGPDGHVIQPGKLQ